MTPPIPKGAPRKRPARSCVTCRASKLKCVGAYTEDDDVIGVAATKCNRCESLGLECEFVALRRKGRPRRLLKTILGRGKKEEESEEEDEEEVQLGESSSSVKAVPPVNLLSIPQAGSTSPESSLGTSASPMDRVWTPPSDVSTPESLVTATLHNPELVAQAYLYNVHPFLPLLPSSLPTLTAYIASSPPLLSQTIWSLSFPTAAPLFPYSTSTFSSTALPDLQAALFVSHYQYGLLAHQSAREFVQFAGKGVLQNGWTRVDSSEKAVARFGSAGAEGEDVEVVKMIRRLVWQTWILEINLSVITGTRHFVLPGLEMEVLVEEPMSNDLVSGQPLTLYIRALSLLHTCTEPPSGNPASATVTESVSNVASNLSAIAFTLYNASTPSSLLEPTPELMAYREAALSVALTACAATIFYLMPSFVPDAFACGLDWTVKLSPYAQSLVRSASQTMFSLLRASLAPLPSSLSQSTPSISLFTHSPMFGCSLLLGSIGAMMTLNGTDDPWYSSAVTSQLELAEIVLGELGTKWETPNRHVKEIRSLRFRIGDDVNQRVMDLTF